MREIVPGFTSCIRNARTRPNGTLPVRASELDQNDPLICGIMPQAPSMVMVCSPFLGFRHRQSKSFSPILRCKEKTPRACAVVPITPTHSVNIFSRHAHPLFNVIPHQSSRYLSSTLIILILITCSVPPAAMKTPSQPNRTQPRKTTKTKKHTHSSTHAHT
jgi:hypothetical protein